MCCPSTSGSKDEGISDLGSWISDFASLNSLPLVSVVVPTFDRARLLPRALDSVRGQSFRDWELIVVDDGSADATRELARRERDPRVRWVGQERSGVSAARNRGIREARGDWLAFLDSDDAWRPSKLERQLEALEHDPQFLACHTDEIWIRRGVRVNPRRVHRKYGGWIYHRCLPLCCISPSSILLHRGLPDRIGGFDENFAVCEDYEMWLRLTHRFPVQFVPEPLVVKYGGHADQLSRSRWGLDRYRVSALVKCYRGCALSHQQRIWTAREIVRKSTILAEGFRKRGKESSARYFRQVSRRYRPER